MTNDMRSAADPPVDFFDRERAAGIAARWPLLEYAWESLTGQRLTPRPIAVRPPPGATLAQATVVSPARAQPASEPIPTEHVQEGVAEARPSLEELFGRLRKG